MNARQRGAAWLLGALLVGRVLDALDLPFERQDTRAPVPVPADSLAAAAPPEHTTAGAGVAAAPDSGAPPSQRRGSEPAAPIAVNRASAADLQRLPGVGPVLAARIVAERDARGPFQDPGDLRRRVRGIGARTSARLAPHLRFD